MSAVQTTVLPSRVVHQMSPLHLLAEQGARVLVEGKGVRVRDDRGTWYLDAMSGLFNVNAGYGRRDLAEAAAAQMERLAFGSLFFGQGNKPAVRLADALAEVTPASIERFFFTTGGSDANDTAVKLARHVNVLDGRAGKMKIIARRESYHGMTLGATSVTGDEVYHREFGPLVPGVVHIGQPRPGDPLAAEELEQAILREGPETVAAFIAEPVSLPSRVTIPDADYWPAIREICSRHDVLLISDEVITGFGRTGRWFACEHWGLEPDLIVMSKGLSSGYVPIGAVGVSERVYATLAGAEGPLLHGFTAGGHPVACAVAAAAVDAYRRENLIERGAETGAYLRGRLEELAARSDRCGEVRGLGMLLAVDLVADEGAAPGKTAAAVREELIRRGVLLRHYADTLVMGPPLVATREDVDELAAKIEEALA